VGALAPVQHPRRGKQHQAVVHWGDVNGRRSKGEQAQRAAVTRLPAGVQVEDGAQSATVDGFIGVEVHWEAGAAACGTEFHRDDDESCDAIWWQLSRRFA